jgi:trehalose 6-phosphate phosphatase
VSLDEVRAHLADAAVVLDFDGTLAPIVDRPEDARPLAGVPEALAALAPRVRRLTIVTGRPSRFVEELLPGIEVAGQYGNEGAPPIDASVRDEAARIATYVPGATLEDKGSAVAVHVRRSSQPEAAAAHLHGPLARLAAAAGLDLLEGKFVWELAPRGGDKGTVVRRVAEGARALLVAGDDVADVAAFAAARDMAGSGLAVCLVAVLGDGTPAELIGEADLTVDGPEGLLRLLVSM